LATSYATRAGQYASVIHLLHAFNTQKRSPEEAKEFVRAIQQFSLGMQKELLIEEQDLQNSTVDNNKNKRLH